MIEMAATNLRKLPLCLPLPSKRVCVAAVKLAGDVTGDADARGACTGVGHGAGDVRSSRSSAYC